MDQAFNYLKANKLETEADYGYAGVGGTCKYNAAKGVTNDRSYTDVQVNNQAQLEAAVNHGPVSVAIEADKAVF